MQLKLVLQSNSQATCIMGVGKPANLLLRLMAMHLEQ